MYRTNAFNIIEIVAVAQDHGAALDALISAADALDVAAEHMTAKGADTATKTARKLRALYGKMRDSFHDEQTAFERRHG